MRRGLVALLAVSALSIASGCTSSYEPARSPRIATVMDSGQPMFVKDGVHFGSMVWGTGLVDVVRGNPQAEHHARVGRNLIAGGFALSLAGLASDVAGVAVALNNDQPSGEAQTSGLAVGLLVGGIAAGIAGVVLIMSGQPHLYDAINLHNDSVDARRPTSAPLPLGPRVQ